jgi:magnesium transporter
MNVYKIVEEKFTKIPEDSNWYGPDNLFFITCEAHEMPSLVPLFSFDPSTIEECLSIDQYIKFESFDNYDFTTFNYTKCGQAGVETFEINIYASKNYIVLVYDSGLDPIAELEERIVNKKYHLLQKQGNILNEIYYLIFDKTISSYFDILEGLEDSIEEIEQDILVNVRREQIDSILVLKNQISHIRKNINPMLYIGDALLINDNNIISKPMLKYFTSLDMRINKLNDFASSLKLLINETRNAYDSKISSRTNDKATLITIIAAFFAPPTVIAGIYGMNFRHMPELDWLFGYPFALIMMFAASGIMYAFLKYKKWL